MNLKSALLLIFVAGGSKGERSTGGVYSSLLNLFVEIIFPRNTRMEIFSFSLKKYVA
jgi:hypothetical protein